MKKETIMRFFSVPTAKRLCGARRVAMLLVILLTMTVQTAWADDPLSLPAPDGEGNVTITTPGTYNASGTITGSLYINTSDEVILNVGNLTVQGNLQLDGGTLTLYVHDGSHINAQDIPVVNTLYMDGGEITCNSIGFQSGTVSDGTINALAIGAAGTISGGTLTATDRFIAGVYNNPTAYYLTISGGIISAPTIDILTETTINVTDPNFSIAADTYENSWSRVLTISGRSLIDEDGYVYAAGEVDLSAIAGKTLRPAYTVTFDENGGSDVSDLTVAGGSTISDPGSTKTGYTATWKEGGVEYDFTAKVENDLTLTAHWAANTYTVHFDANGGSGEMADMNLTYDGDYATLTAFGFTAPEGKAFKNWNTADDGSGESYNDEESVQNLTYVPNGIVTLYAQWVTVAKIGETEYSSVKAAMDAAKSGDVITVLEDVNEPETACGSSPSYSGAFTLNLNGHSVTLASITMSASLTVKNGTLRCVLNNPDTGNNETLTLDNAEVHCEGEYKNEVWDFGIQWMAKNIAVTNGSMLYIMGNTFLGGSGDDGFSLYIDGTSRVVLKEATLSGYNDARVRSEFAKYLPSGYSINTDGKVTFGGSEYTDPVTLSTIALVDNADNSAIITANASSENNVTLQDRTLYRDGDWNTLCLPFAVSNFTGTPLEGATVMELDVDNKYNGSGIIDNQDGTFQTGLDGSTLYLYFKDATSIVAGNPYIIKWGNKNSHPDTDITNPVFSGVTISSTTPTLIKSTDTNVGFIGNYNRVTLTGGDASNLYLGVKDGKNTLFWPSSDRQINAFRAYFIIYPLQSGGGQAPELKIVLNFGEDSDENTTGIIEVNTNNTNLTNKAEGVFDLQGRRIANGQKPTAKGLYIVNGKKVVIK